MVRLNNVVIDVETEQDAPFVRHRRHPTTRHFDPDDVHEVHARLAKEQFTKMQQLCPTGGDYWHSSEKPIIASIDHVINKSLGAKFDAFKNGLVEKGVDAKELLLFHGTPVENVDRILEKNFDPSRISRTAFGRGMYFSEFPSVSVRYGRVLLLCRVLLGRAQPSEAAGDVFRPEQGYDSLTVQLSKDSESKERLRQAGLNMDESAEIHVIRHPDQILPYCVINLEGSMPSSRHLASSKMPQSTTRSQPSATVTASTSSAGASTSYGRSAASYASHIAARQAREIARLRARNAESKRALAQYAAAGGSATATAPSTSSSSGAVNYFIKNNMEHKYMMQMTMAIQNSLAQGNAQGKCSVPRMNTVPAPTPLKQTLKVKLGKIKVSAVQSLSISSTNNASVAQPYPMTSFMDPTMLLSLQPQMMGSSNGVGNTNNNKLVPTHSSAEVLPQSLNELKRLVLQKCLVCFHVDNTVKLHYRAQVCVSCSSFFSSLIKDTEFSKLVECMEVLEGRSMCLFDNTRGPQSPFFSCMYCRFASCLTAGLNWRDVQLELGLTLDEEEQLRDLLTVFVTDLKERIVVPQALIDHLSR